MMWTLRRILFCSFWLTIAAAPQLGDQYRFIRTSASQGLAEEFCGGSMASCLTLYFTSHRWRVGEKG